MSPGLRICTDGSIEARTDRDPPAERTYRKRNGKQRPLAIAALDDKIVQGANVMLLNAIYEGDFFSGFPSAARTRARSYAGIAAVKGYDFRRDRAEIDEPLLSCDPSDF